MHWSTTALTAERRKESRGWLPGQLGPRGGGPETQDSQAEREQDPAPTATRHHGAKGRGRCWARARSRAARAGRPPVRRRPSWTACTCLRRQTSWRPRGQASQETRRAGSRGLWVGPREQDPGQREEGAEAGNASGELLTVPTPHCCCLPPPCTCMAGRMQTTSAPSRGRLLHSRPPSPASSPHWPSAALASGSPGCLIYALHPPTCS